MNPKNFKKNIELTTRMLKNVNRGRRKSEDGLKHEA
jgi:hypothetical protein